MREEVYYTSKEAKAARATKFAPEGWEIKPMHDGRFILRQVCNGMGIPLF